LLTIGLTWFTYNIVDTQEQEEFISVANEIQLKIDARLHAHALILNAGRNYFHLSDTVTREEWQRFTEGSEIDKYLPGITGVGYAVVIPKDKLDEHIRRIRREGFPEYTVYPKGEREIYTSIIYLEPFSGRNLRAFGFDMYSEPVRRKAMQRACDYDVAALTGKVDLVQETDEDVQAGSLMYKPVYKKNAALNTIGQRRAALAGWVYSPYRMDDLMQGILGPWDAVDNPEERIHLQIFADSISVSSLLYDSQKNEPEMETFLSPRIITIPLEFNGTNWILHFEKSRNNIWYGEVVLVFAGGVIISILLYLLSLSYARITIRSKQIKRQNEELQKINATKDKFFSIIAHDLKSPFNTIVGFSNMLVKHVRQKHHEGTERVAEIINSSATNAMDLLMNLMEWSQSQTGHMRFNPVNFDMVKLIHEVEKIFINTAIQKSITIEKELPAKAKVTADQSMISTVLRNFISNAVKYTESGGKVVIAAKFSPDKLIVLVSDTGVGIPEDKAEKLFRIDETFSTTGTQNEKGTGLGLVLCKEFIDYHDGEIGVESTEGKGSTFYFSIPRSVTKDKGKRKRQRRFLKSKNRDERSA
ncbi:MAG: CHASE domain-containing protein, partial [Prolixibacteraceae bacterium]